MSKNVTHNPKIILEWANPLGDKEKPHAYRWRLDFYWFSFRIHKWICSDDERAYHSHPVNMWVWIIKGGYWDSSPIDTKGVVPPDTAHVEYYSTGSIHKIKRDYKHYVSIVHVPTWSLLFTWGAPQRWAFWDKLTGKRMNRDKYFLEKGNHICN